MLVFANILFKFLIFYPHFPTFYQQDTPSTQNLYPLYFPSEPKEIEPRREKHFSSRLGGVKKVSSFLTL